MKVLYLLNHAGKAGTERYVETLVRYLSADGRVKPYFAYNEPGLLVERMQAMSVPCRQIEMRSPYDLPAAKVLANLCREWGIELIHTHYLRENYIAMLAKGRNKAIRSVYTNHFVLANSSLNRLSNRLMDRRQDRMIAVCNLGREQLVKNGWSRDKKKGSDRFDRIPLTFVEEVRVDRREDYMQFIPYEIPEEFTAKDFAACAKIPVRLAQTVLLILTDLLIVERIGKQGRSYLYRICEIE